MRARWLDVPVRGGNSSPSQTRAATPSASKRRFHDHEIRRRTSATRIRQSPLPAVAEEHITLFVRPAQRYRRIERKSQSLLGPFVHQTGQYFTPTAIAHAQRGGTSLEFSTPAPVPASTTYGGASLDF